VFLAPFFVFSATAGQLADRVDKAGLIRWIKVAEVAIMVLAAVGFWFQQVELLLVVLGLMEKAVALSPGFPAVLTAMVYQALPYTILVLYPALVRLDPTLTEAARTLGASPLRAFFTVVVPALRTTILATLIMVFIFALGSYLLPQILGRPQHWTLSVLITDQAIYQSNMPFAAAMAVFLVLVTLAMVALTLFVGRKREATT